ncbi:MAG: hypothetical protein HQ555_02515 [Candidatus Aminicenantes bacterium]|nr:hypothetical protein [Candidatus Aminicenantes bacterium]
MKEKVLRLNLYIGLIILVVSVLLLIRQVVFMKTWFFSFAWWSFILIMDSINFRKTKSSPLSGPFRNFLFTAFISVFVWLIFELFNLRVKNWTYHNLPPGLFIRWLGYFVAYATVIPAMREISFFIHSFLGRKKLGLFRIQPTPVLLRVFVFIGVVFFLLGLSLPRFFFPFVWLCFIFLLEPINYWLKNETFVEDADKKDWSKFWSWVLAGLVAGFLWEFWNFWAGSHWEYSLPYLNFWRVFQMPVLGYTGFMPFALEVFALYQILFSVYKKLQNKIIFKSIIFILMLLFYILGFYLIDTFTLIR